MKIETRRRLVAQILERGGYDNGKLDRERRRRMFNIHRDSVSAHT